MLEDANATIERTSTAQSKPPEAAAKARLSPVAFIVYSVLGLALLSAFLDLPYQWAYVQPVLNVARLWSDSDAQHRIQAYEGSYDLLREADRMLPADASVLLVTPGREVASREYTAYHRALYLLAPRPVWWLSPAPSDGTWKARWWISAPLEFETMRSVATGRSAKYVLFYNLEPSPGLGIERVIMHDGGLVRLEGSSAFRQGGFTPRAAAALWPLPMGVALAVILLIGSAPVALAARLGYASHSVEAYGLAWLLGAGLISVLMFWLNGVGLGLRGQIVVLTLGAVAWGVWMVRYGVPSGARLRRRASHTNLERVPSTKHRVPSRTGHSVLGAWYSVLLDYSFALRGALALFLLAPVALVVLLAVGRPLQVWDSWVNWGMKANIIFLEGGVTPALYADTSRTVTHLDYPLYVPMVQAWLYGWLGAIDDRLAGAPSVLHFLALLAVCYGALRGWGAGRTLSLVAIVALGTMWNIAGLAGLVFAEAPLVALATVAGLYTLRWLEGGPTGALLVAAIGAGLMPWVKREGLVLVAALCLALLLVGWRSARAWAAIGAVAAGAGVLSGPWWGFVAANGVVNAAFGPITLATLQANLDRVGMIAVRTCEALLNPHLSYIWPLAAILYFGFWILDFGWTGSKSKIQNPKSKISLPSGRPKWNGFLPLAAVIYVLLSGFTYIFSTFVPFEQHVISSIDRLIAQVTPLALLWVVLLALPQPGVGAEFEGEDVAQRAAETANP
jgi:hypothetical protein